MYYTQFLLIKQNKKENNNYLEFTGLRQLNTGWQLLTKFI